MEEYKEEDQVKCKNCRCYNFMKHPDGSNSPAGWCEIDPHKRFLHPDVLFFCYRYEEKEDVVMSRIEMKAW